MHWQAVGLGTYSCEATAEDGPVLLDDGTVSNFSERTLLTAAGITQGIDIREFLSLVEVVPIVLPQQKVSQTDHQCSHGYCIHTTTVIHCCIVKCCAAGAHARTAAIQSQFYCALVHTAAVCTYQ
jgi:hypothetical protein